MGELIELLVDFIMHLVATLGYAGVFVAHFAESAWIPVTSEVFLLFGGFLVLQDRFTFWGIVLAASAGFAAGSLVPFFLSRYGGLPLVMRYGKYIHLTEKRVHRVQGWFAEYGDWIVLATRSIPVLRNVITMPAGMSAINPVKFFTYTFGGFLPWAAFVTYLGVKMGQRWERITPYFEILATAVVVASAAAIVFLAIKLWQNRSS